MSTSEILGKEGEVSKRLKKRLIKVLSWLLVTVTA